VAARGAGGARAHPPDAASVRVGGACVPLLMFLSGARRLAQGAVRLVAPRSWPGGRVVRWRGAREPLMAEARSCRNRRRFVPLLLRLVAASPPGHGRRSRPHAGRAWRPSPDARLRSAAAAPRSTWGHAGGTALPGIGRLIDRAGSRPADGGGGAGRGGAGMSR
jgi:hypothetical protein